MNFFHLVFYSFNTIRNTNTERLLSHCANFRILGTANVAKKDEIEEALNTNGRKLLS